MIRLATIDGVPVSRPSLPGWRVDLIRDGECWASDVPLSRVIPDDMPVGTLAVIVASLERTGEAPGMRLSTTEGRHADRG